MALARENVPPVVEPARPVVEVKFIGFPETGSPLLSVTVAVSVVCPPTLTATGAKVTATLARTTVRFALPVAVPAVAVSLSVQEDTVQVPAV